jgi:hypothetical protein
MLVSPRLAGMRVHRGRVIPSEIIPAILDGETAERVRQILDRPGGSFTRRPRALSGLVRCGRCGERMTVKHRQTGGALYRCFRSPGEPNCGRMVVAAEPLEELVGAALAEALDATGLAEALAEAGGQAGEIARDLVRLQTQREELVRDHYVDGFVSRGDFLPAHAAISDRITRAEVELARHRRRELLVSLRPGETVAGAWASREPSWCRELARAHIERIVIAPANRRGLNRLDPGRVEVRWRQ